MQISTLFYQVKKMVGGISKKKADCLLTNGLSDLHKPSEQSIKSVLAFSNAYNYDKSDAIGDLEYFSN